MRHADFGLSRNILPKIKKKLGGKTSSIWKNLEAK